MDRPGFDIKRAVSQMREPAFLTKIMEYVAEARKTDAEAVEGSVRRALTAGVRHGFIRRARRVFVPYFSSIQKSRHSLNKEKIHRNDENLKCGIKSTGPLHNRSRRAGRPKRRRNSRSRARSRSKSRSRSRSRFRSRRRRRR